VIFVKKIEQRSAAKYAVQIYAEKISWNEVAEYVVAEKELFEQ